MSNLSYFISVLLLLVKFETKEKKANKIACTCTTFSGHWPTHTRGFEGADWGFLALGLNLNFKDSLNEIKSCFRKLITFDRSLVYIFCLPKSPE